MFFPFGGNAMTSTLHPTPTTCPISGAPAEQLPTRGDRRELLSPSVGGRYALTGTADAILHRRSPLNHRQRKFLVGRIAARRCRGQVCPLITSSDLEDVLGRRSG
jgi:hypothetical protein